MIQLHDKEKGTVLGVISEDDLQFLIDHLEEESETDTDYYINRSTIDFFKEKGASERLLTLLEEALGDRTEMEIDWIRSD